ncbi:MAG: hypothetical protein KC912_11810 [Proteobacteria bacterium]|nr:hypothetical protein [Pseudomonadota bacterium]
MRVVWFAVVGVACGASKPTVSTQPVDDVPAQPELVPFPFTPDQIRAASPEGREVVFRIRDESTASWQRITFAAVNETGASIEGRAWPEGGAETPAEIGEATWAELQAHASFPLDATAVEPGHSVTVPAGTFSATRYTVEGDGETSYFFFAPSLPGPPVLMVSELADGIWVMEMVSSGIPTSP